MTEEDAAALLPHVIAANAANLAKFEQLLIPKTLKNELFVKLYKCPPPPKAKKK
jgi:hypothetical protein